MTNAQAHKLLRWLERTHHLEHLSDNALGELLTETLWASLRLGTPDSDALAEAIARLKGERQTHQEGGGCVHEVPETPPAGPMPEPGRGGARVLSSAERVV